MTQEPHSALATYGDLVAALEQATNALDIATDWHFEEVELDGEWHQVSDIVSDNRALLKLAKARAKGAGND